MRKVWKWINDGKGKVEIDDAGIWCERRGIVKDREKEKGDEDKL